LTDKEIANKNGTRIDYIVNRKHTKGLYYSLKPSIMKEYPAYSSKSKTSSLNNSHRRSGIDAALIHLGVRIAAAATKKEEIKNKMCSK
jgi:ethanolamine utilization protein EutQ (cupin superfamily)